MSSRRIARGGRSGVATRVGWLVWCGGRTAGGFGTKVLLRSGRRSANAATRGGGGGRSRRGIRDKSDWAVHSVKARPECTKGLDESDAHKASEDTAVAAGRGSRFGHTIEKKQRRIT